MHCCPLNKKLSLDKRLKSDSTFTPLQVPSGIIDFAATQLDWNEYLKFMSEDGVWADDVILQGMACCLKNDIFVVTSSTEGNAEPTYQRAFGDINFNGTPIRIGHVHGCHYRSLGKLNFAL